MRGDMKMKRQHEVRFLTFGICLIVVTALPFLFFCTLKLFGFADSTVADAVPEAAVSLNQADTDFQEEPACLVSIRSPVLYITVPAQKCLNVVCGEGCTVREPEAEEAVAEPEDPTAVEEPEEIAWYHGANVYDFVHWSAILSFTVTISIVGVMSSILTRSNGYRRNVRIDNATDIITIMFFTSVSGFLLLMLCIGGFLGGSLFPRFDGGIKNFGFNSWSGLDFRGPEWGKLAVWAYISGFYERFIPGVFDQLLDGERKSQIGGQENGGATKEGSP